MEHVAPLHNVETIDNVAEKQIGQMEALIHAAHNKQAELHEIFRLIDADQSRLNASFQHAQYNVDESANCIIQMVQEAQRTLSKELENAFGYKQLQLTNIEREVQKMVKKMSQTMEFTQRLLKYSSPTEVMVFKPLLDARIQGFLNFNADTSSFTSNSCEIETQPLNVAQARQTVFALMNSVQSTAVAAAATASATATAVAAAAAASAIGDSSTTPSTWPDSALLAAEQSHHHQQQQQILEQQQQQQQQLNQSHQNHSTHQQSQQQRFGSASPTSLLFYQHHQEQQQQQPRHQSFSTSLHSGNDNGQMAPIGRSVSRQMFMAGRQSSQMQGAAQNQRSPPRIGNLGGGNSSSSRLASSIFDTSAFSDSNLAVRGAANDFGTGGCGSESSHSLGGSALNGIPISGASGHNGNDSAALNAALLNLGGSGCFPIGASAPTGGAAANFLSHHLDSGRNNDSNSGNGLGLHAHLNPFTTSASVGAASDMASVFNQYEKWSSGLDPSSLGALSLSDPDTITDLSILANAQMGGDKLASALGAVAANQASGGAGGGLNAAAAAAAAAFQLYPPRSQIKRQKMTYHCKFGEFGVMEGQFTEPSGVTVNAQNDIIVADTNNHRIQVFDKEGRFKFQFGECGKRDGQLLYPNRVSVNRVTGDFIVTERSPTHQIQIYNQYGHFVRKFGANILQHPRGVCVDNQGRIIVVECKVMRVIIFDAFGNVIHKFSCSRYLEFPNGVCTNDKNEILISDNRAHCIKVFNYEGHYVRQIGGEGITNYPIGVGINGQGEVIVADNHNNFNLTVFSQDGTMLNALESKVKHAQCFDVALVEDGSVVLASKDYRLYLYRYQSQQQSQL